MTKKYPTKQTLYFSYICTSFLIAVLGVAIIWQTHQSTELTSQVAYLTDVLGSYTHTMDTYRMLDPSLYPKTELNGVYRGNSFFCVWTKDRTPEEINNTFCHESAHDFVYKDYEGFCESGHDLEFDPYPETNESEIVINNSKFSNTTILWFNGTGWINVSVLYLGGE